MCGAKVIHGVRTFSAGIGLFMQLFARLRNQIGTDMSRRSLNGSGFGNIYDSITARNVSDFYSVFTVIIL
jgi:hypothetical protein